MWRLAASPTYNRAGDCFRIDFFHKPRSRSVPWHEIAWRYLDLQLGLIALFPPNSCTEASWRLSDDWGVHLNQGVAMMTERISAFRRRMIEDMNARGLSAGGQRAPVILNVNEVKRLLAVARPLKVKVLLSIAYGTGMRAGEVVRLKVGDIDSDQMIIRPKNLAGHPGQGQEGPPG